MSHCRFYAQLFGSLELFYGEESIQLPGSSKARSLLVYLLLKPDQYHQRSTVAGLLWSEHPDANALRRLSQALWQVRSIITDALITEQEQIGIFSFNSDVSEFEKLLNSPQAAGAGAKRRIDLLTAVGLYRGDLLEGFYHDWILFERERLRELYLHALEQLADEEKRAGDYHLALEHVLKRVSLEPFYEPAQRELMRLYYALNRPDAALQQYTNLQILLKHEINCEPEAETQALVAEIIARQSTLDHSQKSSFLPLVSPESNFFNQRKIPLLGRDKERKQIIGIVKDLFAGMGGLLLIEGEAGIGKSKLVEELSNNAEWHGVQGIWGYCTETNRQDPYHSIRSAIQSALTPLKIGQLNALMERSWRFALLDLFPELTGDDRQDLEHTVLEIEETQEQLNQALIHLIGIFGKIKPLVIILEDLHWVDDATLDLLVRVANRVKDSPVFIVGTYRGDDARMQPELWRKLNQIMENSCVELLRLKALDQESCGQITRRMLGIKNTAPLFEARLYRETGGNPLFLGEVLRVLYDQGYLFKDLQGDWHTPWDETTLDYQEMPKVEAVEQVVQKRLQMIDPSMRKILEIAAVIEQEIEYGILRMVCECTDDELLPALAGLVQRNFLIETPDTYQFSHEKIQQVVYQNIPSQNLKNLHQRVFFALVKKHPKSTVQLAKHSYLAELWEQAAVYCQIAGEMAERLFAHRQVVENFQRAINSLEKSSVQVDPITIFNLRLRRENANAMLSDSASRLDDLLALDKLILAAPLNTPDHQVIIYLRWADFWFDAGDYGKVKDKAQKAIDLAEKENLYSFSYQGHAKLGNMYLQNGELNQAGYHFQQALELAIRLDDRTLQAQIANHLGVIEFRKGNYDQALMFFLRGLNLNNDQNKNIAAWLHNSLGNLFHYLASYPTCFEHYQKAIELHQLLGNLRGEVSVLYNLGSSYFDHGQLEAARDTMQKVCMVASDLGDRRIEGYGWVFLGLILEEAGEHENARQAYEKGLLLRQQVGLKALEIDAIAGLARVETLQGDHERAVNYATQALEWLENQGIEGVGDPLLAYKGVYRAFLAAGDEISGRKALETAYSLLLRFAENISDPKRKSAYLHEIDPGKAIWDDYHAQFKQQIRIRIPRCDAPTGRELQEDEWTEVLWTIETLEDQAIQNKANRRRQILARLQAEASQQNAIPRVADYALVLKTSDVTIKRDLAMLKKQGIHIKQRGKQKNDP